jgi:hypothetical protein
LAAKPAAADRAGNRAFAAAEPVGDLRLHFSSSVLVGYDFTLFQGKMTCHRGDSFLNGPSSKTPIQTSPRCFHLYQFSIFP